MATEEKKSLTLEEAINVIQERIDSESNDAKQMWDKAYTMSVAKDASKIDSWVAGAKWALDILNSVENHGWQTGTPTESGEYIVEYLCNGNIYHIYDIFNKGHWMSIDEDNILAWIKINNYKNQDDLPKVCSDCTKNNYCSMKDDKKTYCISYVDITKLT